MDGRKIFGIDSGRTHSDNFNVVSTRSYLI
jgi:hypothetical protein